jgi:DNA-binding transcriptional regulator GbsR (MarR family)
MAPAARNPARGEGASIMTTADDRAQYIEEVGIVMEGYGLPRMWGRVFGALLVADPPEQSAEQLAETLRASRGSISTATRMLEQASLIDRLHKPGERRDYFRNRPGAWHEINRKRAEAMGALVGLAEKGLRVVDSDEPEVRRGLEEMLAFMRFMRREYPRLLATWEREFTEHAPGASAPGGRD